jgi:hypothetical protein
MAIREVLVSFTFEQQRLMLNLIGADVGDASLLLTPTNVVVTAINEVITGDVDLSNQTIGMDDGTLASPSLFWDAGQGFYKVDANKLGLTTSLAVTGNLEVDGDITFRAGNGTGGTLTFGDLDTDNIVINADVQSSIVPDSTANYNLGTAAKQWNNLWIDGTASIDTLEVDLNTTLTGDLSVNSGIIKVDPSTVGTASIFNDYVATAQVLMDASSITIGSNAPGTFMIRNSNITTPKTTINVFNTIAETVNAFGAASNVVTGLSTFGTTGVNSNYNIRSDDTVLDGDLNVNGGEILSQENTFDLLIANNDVRIGAANGVGETVINNSLKVTENVNLANSGTNVTIKDNTTNALAIKEGTNTYVQIQTTDSSERIIVYKDLYVVGNLDISGTSTVIDTTTLTVEDKNIELGTSGSPTDALADGGGITLKATTDKTIAYSNSTGMWESNIGWRVDHANNAGSDLLARFGNANNSGTNSAHLLLANGYYASPTDVDGTGAAAKILSDGNATFAGNLDSYGVVSKGTAASTNIWTGYHIDGATNPINSTITAAGDATFAGQVTPSAVSIVADTITTAGTSYFACSDSVGGYSSKIIFYSGGSATFAGTVSDSKGDLRKIIFKQESSAYTLVAADAGKAIEIATGGITVPVNVFVGGDAITIINDSSSDQTITQGSSVTMFNAGTTNSGNRTLAGRGMATVYFVNSSTCYISGAGLT